MILSSYETHQFPNPILPFIYHPLYQLTASEVETNWHKNIEVLYCFQGSGYVRCGAEIYDFTPGDAVAVNTDLLHTVGTATELSYCCLIVGSNFLKENGFPAENLAFINVIRNPALPSLMNAVAVARQNCESGDLCAAADYRYAVLGLLRCLCREHCILQHEIPPQNIGAHTKSAITYIRKHFAEKITLDHIAAYIGISKFHLAREFKTMTGNTIVCFINTLRCLEAKRLIENGMQVSVAAYACGFDNLSYFSRTFQRVVGALPSAYKK